MKKVSILNKIVLTLILFFSTTDVTYSQFFRQMTLIGLDSIEVNIIIDNETEPSSFAQSLKNRAELRLRQNNIKIGTDEDVTSLSFSVLILDISFGNGPISGQVARYDLELSKLTNIDNQFFPSQAILWQSGGILTTSTNNLNSDLKESLESSLDAFLNEYLEANEDLDD